MTTFSQVLADFPRPATLALSNQPSRVFSSPDGACLMLLYQSVDEDSTLMQAYHWASFGSNEGISLHIASTDGDSMALTSFVNRGSVFLLSLDIPSQTCKSIALNITKKATEFTFKEKGGGYSVQPSEAPTMHNCLLDCHRDVWTRFPVAAAVTHRGICQNLTFGIGEYWIRSTSLETH